MITSQAFDPNFFRGHELSGPGWTPDHPDADDKVYSVSLSNYPSSTFLHKLHPLAFQRQVEDQLQSSSCTGQATTAWAEFVNFLKSGKWLDFARLLTYWGARSYRGWQNQDSGALIRDCFKWLTEKGLALESFYQFGMANLFKVPSAEVLEQASRHKVNDARRVERGDVCKAISAGYPVVGGFTCYSDAVFGQQAQATGYIRAPKAGDRQVGGHAVLFSWYDEARGLIGGPNSWGPRWGQQNEVKSGWFTMPLDYINNPNLSDDFWTATDITL